MNKISTAAPIRCFVAISLPVPENAAAIVEDLAKLAETDGLQLRTVPAENFHITLKFLGNVDADQLGFLDSILRNQCAKHAPLTLRSRGIGFFSDSLHLHIEQDERLNRLVSDLNEAFAFLGYEKEGKKYLPHITLARFKSAVSSDLSALLPREYFHQDWGEFSVESIQLIQSETLTEGARYKVLDSYPLNGTIDC